MVEHLVYTEGVASSSLALPRGARRRVKWKGVNRVARE